MDNVPKVEPLFADFSVFPEVLSDDIVDRILDFYDRYEEEVSETVATGAARENIDSLMPDIGDLEVDSLTEEEREQFNKEIQEFRDHFREKYKEERSEENEYRSCKKHVVNLLAESWLATILERFANISNHKWMLDIDIIDQMEVLNYKEGNDKYDWHRDSEILMDVPRDRCRKLTIIVQLSDSEDYEGCDLEISNESPQVDYDTDVLSPHREAIRKKGTVIIFPAFQKHRITPLISGNRKSLVAWVNGRPWR
jgi:hypothetical protein